LNLLFESAIRSLERFKTRAWDEFSGDRIGEEAKADDGDAGVDALPRLGGDGLATLDALATGRGAPGLRIALADGKTEGTGN
jgi:hypothetical protein